MSQTDVKALLDQIENLEREAVQLEEAYSDSLQQLHPDHQVSGKNLLHYLALRQHDIRQLQVKLAELGLSSLGRSESHVRASMQAVQNQLRLQLGAKSSATSISPTYSQSNTLLKQHTADLLGEPAAGREVRIMVTFSTDLATDVKMVSGMLQAGMNCARLNCAHDDSTVWAQMIQTIRQAEKETGKKCRILFDLMGPKLRTGSLQPGPQVIAVHPEIDQTGHLISPVKVWIAPPGQKTPGAGHVMLPVNADWLQEVPIGAELKFKDTRGRFRTLQVLQRTGGGLVAQLVKTAYISTGTQLTYQDKGKDPQTAAVEKLPSMEIPLLLKKGHELLLHKDNIPGEPARYDEHGNMVSPAHISCTLPEIFSQVKAGEPILFDDGEIEGVIEDVQEDLLRIKITAADELGSKLRADKGINLPESNLLINNLTEKDKTDLAFVVQHADIINLSFVNHPQIVEELQEELRKYKAEHIAIMLKIETKAGFSNLPYLLLTLMRWNHAGIMIARGDLAVEGGWQRLAELQEEILWLCEAAHLPVVWATQVLEKLAKKGKPSRAEITDAAMAQRADCVMLNKGPYIIKAIEMLDGILKRMQEHQYKKTPLLRSLHVSEMSGFYQKRATS